MKPKYLPATGQLIYGENETVLGKQTKICMDYFISQSGNIVTKDELHQACWGKRGLVVSDSTVRQTLYRLRKSFQDIGITEEILITHSRNKYYLVLDAVDVEMLENKVSSENSPGVGKPEDTTFQESEAVLSANESENVLSDTPKTSCYRALTSPVTLLFILFFLLAGAGARAFFLIHPVKYVLFEQYHGRVYFFSEAFAGEKNTAVWRAEYWLNYQIPEVSLSKYVYVNGLRTNLVSMIVCRNKIEDRMSDCQSVNVIGKKRQ